MISEELKCIYIHIPKVAGTSISYELSKYTKHPNVLLDIINRLGRKYRNRNPFPHYNQNLSSHARAVNYLDAIKDYNDYYSFTFVRNPYDWVVSNYEYVKQSINHSRHHLAKDLSFFQFVKLYPCTGTFQIDFVTDNNGDVIVDFIGKYENIKDDIHTIGGKLGIDISLPRKNTTVRKNWTNYYDKKTAELVISKFKNDFEFFGYSTEYY